MSFMAIDNHSHYFPSFFKIILEPRHDLYKLGIPIKFMTDHGNDLLDVVSLKIPTGKTWIVELLEENGRAWFGDGWHEFVNYYSICHGHFLVFTYGGMSRFNVLIFDMTACEIEYPLDPQETEVPRTVSETQIIKINPCSPCSSSKENGMLALVGQYRRNFGTLTREHIKKINSYQFENPCFTIIMHPSQLTNDFRCTVPAKFAAKYLMKTRGSCTLENATCDTWPVRLERNTGHVRLSGGWRKYALDNKLRVGDICVFELINVAKRLFQVEIIRCSSRALSTVCVAGPSSPMKSSEQEIEVLLIDD